MLATVKSGIKSVGGDLGFIVSNSDTLEFVKSVGGKLGVAESEEDAADKSGVRTRITRNTKKFSLSHLTVILSFFFGHTLSHDVSSWTISQACSDQL